MTTLTATKPQTYSNGNSSLAVEALNMHVYYGDFRAVKNVSLNVPEKAITALIGPSGCGKSTVLRSFNRMNDLVSTARVEGSIFYHGQDIYADNVDPVEIRRRIGMVFQKPNPFSKSIYDNVAWGAKINRPLAEVTLPQERDCTEPQLS